MPNFDGGHYFLTALAPIHADPCNGTDDVVTSPTAAVREALATLPTAFQTEASVQSGRPSPFSRCHRTHFARLVVIDQPAFGGRTPGNSLIEAIRKTDLLVHEPVDTLTRAWVMLAVDFDPGSEPDHGLHEYLAGLWDVMADELRAIYGHCYDFTATVQNRDGFARYIQRCQVETTMPFNDYALPAAALPTLPLPAMGIAAAVFVIAVTAIVGRAGFGWGLLAFFVAIGIAVFAAYKFACARGGRLFPNQPGTDLRTVLKALYLQQNFARFAIANQGVSPDALHAAFADFAAITRPGETGGPTQDPGAIRS